MQVLLDERRSVDRRDDIVAIAVHGEERDIGRRSVANDAARVVADARHVDVRPARMTESALAAEDAAPHARPECASTPRTSRGYRTPSTAASAPPAESPATQTRSRRAR